ncbi:ATP-grasp domain-containing protein [Thalassospira lucentensis]|uniref:ATP-grasp domain-containing protein n=1 Tax=Thalassospira lucentensis TaxID=168935 RepID=UPI00399D5FE3
MRVLVSGVAGDIGFGVGRVLQYWGVCERLYGLDVIEDHPGQFVFDQVDLAPSASDVSYIDWIYDYVKAHSIDLFIPTSEAEISIVSRSLSRLQVVTKVLVNDPDLVSICLDKHKTLQHLAERGVPVPAHGVVGCDEPDEFPLIVKPRNGQGSRGLRKVNSLDDLRSSPTGFVWQKMLLPDQEEYTCAVYANAHQEMQCIQIKRTLIGGYTGKGVVCKNLDILQYVKKISDVLQVNGCVNVQLRMTEAGPLLFEINPRLSSTLVFRDKLGFTDLRWWICDFLGLAKLPYLEPPAGTKIYRGNAEYIFK